MGREIRRVPINWEHPKDSQGFIPMYNKTYREAADEWEASYAAFKAGAHEEQEYLNGLMASDSYQGYYFEYDWCPNEDDGDYRPAFESAPVNYQIYETVSKGTPTSPVFASESQMRDWLLSEGYSQEASDSFIKSCSAPSMMMIPGEGLVMDIESLGAVERASRKEVSK